MGSKLCILVCENLSREAESVISSESWNDVALSVFPASCGHANVEKAIHGIVQASEVDRQDTRLLGGACISELQNLSADCVHCHPRGLCFSFFVNSGILQKLLTSGAYLLTPGWLANWRRQIDEWGFSRETAIPFFKESASRLVLLDTGVDPDSHQKLLEFADFLGLPFQVEPVGLDLFRLYLARIVLDWRVANQQDSSVSASIKSDPTVAEYAMVMDFLQRIGRISDESKVIEKIIELFNLLCAPGRMAYLSIRDGRPLDVQFAGELAQDAELIKARLADFHEDYGWTESGKGFIVRIGAHSETLGVLELDDLSFPQSREHYLNLAMNITGVCSLAISNARTYRKLKQSLETLRQNREWLRVTLSSIGDAVMATDDSGLVTLINPIGEELTGWNSEDAVGQPVQSVFRIINEKTGHPAENIVERVLREGSVANLVNNTALITRNGRKIPIEDSASPIRDGKGKMIGAVLVFHDVTQKRRSIEALEERNQALRDFASIASHDLQEPLRKVKSFGSMLKQKCGDSLGEEGQAYLDRVLNANQRMQSLLSALLEYSRLTTRTDPFVKVEPAKIIQEVLSDLEVRIANTGGEVHVGDMPVISADPTQMRQLFQNLIGNALKFHKPGEKPIVRVRSVSDTDSGCRIIVEDNGIGFEEQYLEKIFAPFQRLHGRSSQYEGTGMGLAICKKIVERHGGSITARSTPGQGAMFIITLS